jgi:RHS repeat-associated protein
MGDTPVATLRPSGTTIAIYYVHSDHLGTPRKVTRASDNGLMWRWDPDTFGSVAPNNNPSGLGAFTYNLRFPGQYLLTESGLFYNHFRDYDPNVGRYMESDPIGVKGGVNTYGYVGGNPVSAVDPMGLIKWTGKGTTISADLGGGATRMTFHLTSECIGNQQATVDILAGGFTVGFGINVSATTGTVTFEDDNSTINPDVFAGPAKFVSIGLTLGGADPSIPLQSWQKRGISIGASAVQLGDARSIAPSFQDKLGLEFSVSGGAGISMVRDVKWASCCNQH